MKKTCEQCGKSFQPKRRHGRYCSATCKQYAYLGRNGMTFSDEKKASINVNVPISRTKKLPSLTLETVNDRSIASMTRTYQTINDAGTADQQKDNNEKIKSETVNDLSEESMSRTEQSVNDAPNASKNKENNKNKSLYEAVNKPIDRNTEHESMTDPQRVNDTQKNEQEPYSKVTSALIDRTNKIGLSRQERYGDYRSLFCNADNPAWGQKGNFVVKWVNERFKCLLQSLLTASHCRSISREMLYMLSRGFTLLSESKQFELLPEDYPYCFYIEEKADQLREMLDQASRYKKIKCILSMNQKALLLFTLYEIGDSVLNRKLTQLTF